MFVPSSPAFASSSTFAFPSTPFPSSSSCGTNGVQAGTQKLLCLSCREQYSAGKAGTCKECYKEASETKEELKREIEELKSKVKFLTCRSPADQDNPSSSYFTDVVLLASDEDFGTGPPPLVAAHKGILVSRSPVFKAMLKTEMEESRSGTIKIGDVSNNVLRSFVHYLYTAEVVLDEQLASDLLVLAEKYEVKHLKAYCEEFMRSKVAVENALASFTFASRHNAKHLLEAALSIVTDNMDKLTKQDVYKELVEKDPRLIVGIYEAYLAKKDNTASPSPVPQNRTQKGL